MRPYRSGGQGDNRSMNWPWATGEGFREHGTDIPTCKKWGNLPEQQRATTMLKGGLRGMRHHVEDLQDYLDEYCRGFNHSFMKDGIFEKLMLRMVKSPP